MTITIIITMKITRTENDTIDGNDDKHDWDNSNGKIRDNPYGQQKQQQQQQHHHHQQQRQHQHHHHHQQQQQQQQ